MHFSRSMPELIDLTTSELEKIRDNFVYEFEAAQNGLPSSLHYLSTPLEFNYSVDENEVFQVITTGGSNLRSATVKTEDNHFKILHSSQSQLPSLSTSNVFFEQIESVLAPDVKVVALNFAYPLASVLREGRLDGELQQAVKEHSFTGLVHELVGESLEHYFAAKGRVLEFSVANDMVCLALAGSISGVETNNLIAGVVGTGINIALYSNEKEIVCLETANFNKFILSGSGRMIDRESQNSGNQLFEKEISGRYLYLHYNYLVEGLGLEILTSGEELNSVAADSEHPGSTIAQGILRRSTSLMAAQLAGIYDIKSLPKLTFAMEGGLFWNGWHYKEMVCERLEELGLTSAHIEFLLVDDSSVLGASRLVSTRV